MAGTRLWKGCNKPFAAFGSNDDKPLLQRKYNGVRPTSLQAAGHNGLDLAYVERPNDSARVPQRASHLLSTDRPFRRNDRASADTSQVIVLLNCLQLL
jgi:hypothetical protein